jgi:hypothetical protein
MLKLQEDLAELWEAELEEGMGLASETATVLE